MVFSLQSVVDSRRALVEAVTAQDCASVSTNGSKTETMRDAVLCVTNAQRNTFTSFLMLRSF
jgi:hypothetical protein